MSINVSRWGQGPPVLLVHGSVTSGADTWGAQRPLAERWTLLVVDRRGYHPNPPADREDFEIDADDIAELLTEPTHLVGHSYGGVVALLAAARRPEMVRSLTVNEPPAFGICRDDPVVAEFAQGIQAFWEHGPSDPGEFLRAFVTQVGGGSVLPDPLPPPLLQNAHLLRNERSPAEAHIPLDRLRSAPFPKLVVSGAHNKAFDAVCDTLERRLEARRAVVSGQGHSVQRTGPAYNEVLDSFLKEAEGAGGRATSRRDPAVIPD